MIVDALEFVYVAARRFQDKQTEGSPRLNPAFLLSLVLTPIAFAVLTITIGAEGIWNEPLGTPVYPKTSVLGLFAFAIACIVVALVFDRRRAALDLKYASLPPLKQTRSQVLAGLGLWLTIVLESALAKRLPFACLATFLLVCAGLSLFLRKIRTRSL